MTRLLSQHRMPLGEITGSLVVAAFLLATIAPASSGTAADRLKPHPLRAVDTAAQSPQQQLTASSLAVVTVRPAPNPLKEAALQVFSNPQRPEVLFSPNDESANDLGIIQLAGGQILDEPALDEAGLRQGVIQVVGQVPTAPDEPFLVPPEEPEVVEPDVVVPPEPENQPPPAPVSQFRPISAINPFHDYAPDGKPCNNLCPKDPNCPSGESEACPEEAPFYTMTPPTRCFAETHYLWTAANLYHNPLYFEDVSLERYGHVKCWCGVQNMLSLGKFGVQLIGLPYQLALDYPHDRRYALGYYQPGDCAPRLCYQVPLNERAAVTAAVFYTGVGFIIPW
jgi:hypothetical protein